MATNPPSANAQPPVRRTSEKLKDLLDLLNIKIVYYVDDENKLADLDIQILVGELEKIYGLNREAELLAIQQANWDRDMPKEGVIDSLRQLWTNISFEEKTELYNAIITISNSPDLVLDFRRSALVATQIPGNIIKVLTPLEWDAERGNLHQVIKDGEKALILFDEELRLAGGRFATIKGQDLIVEVKGLGLGEKVICTLLTGQTTTETELSYRDSIIEHRKNATKEPLNINDFFPLAKERLDDAEVFGDGIKKTLLNSNIEAIKKYSIELIKASYNEAIKKIQDFDTYDFENTILRTSAKDGIWEPETIVRISDIVFENEIRKRMVEKEYVPKFNTELKASQRFSGIQFVIPPNMQPYSDKMVLRHQEIYDSGQVINSLRKPLENGDIFEFMDDKYILVAQACDMAVRKKEDQLGLRTSKVATLLKIAKTYSNVDLHKKERKVNHYFKDKHPLRYFSSGTSDVGIVDFTDYLVVDIDILDLCVFNKEGECKINLNKLEDKSYLTTTWESRYNILIEKFKSFQSKIWGLKKYLLIQGKVIAKGNIRRKAMRRSKNKGAFLGTKVNSIVIQNELYPKFILASSNAVTHSLKIENDGTFNFSIKRIAKYKDFGATYLLDRYTQHLSRIAEPHDFAS